MTSARTSARTSFKTAESPYKADNTASGKAGVTLMNRPRSPLSWNCTMPSIFAKSVWSRPMPTFTPG